MEAGNLINGVVGGIKPRIEWRIAKWNFRRITAPSSQRLVGFQAETLWSHLLGLAGAFILQSQAAAIIGVGGRNV